MNEYELTIKAETLRCILGDYHYRKMAAGTLMFGGPKDKNGERPIFVSSIPMDRLSREKRGAILCHAEKRTVLKRCVLGNNHKRHQLVLLSNKEKALLQELVDERCRVITERYLEDRDRLSVEYMKDMQKPEFRAALSQYPDPYTDPRTVLYFESFDSLYQNHHDEMQRLLNICKTLALKTNPHLDRVLGCNVQSHKCEPRV